MDKCEPDLTGLFYDGEPLALYLDRQVSHEAEQLRSEIINELCKRRPNIKRRFHGHIEKNGVAKRVRYLSPKEIRKEYGLMSLPHKTITENILWVVFEQGPVSASEIAKKIGAGLNSVTSILYVINKHLSEVIERQNTVPFTYKPLKSMSPEAAVTLMNDRIREDRKKLKSAPTPSLLDKIREDRKNPPPSTNFTKNLTENLLSKFPAFDNTWSEDLKLKWFEVFNRLVDDKK